MKNYYYILGISKEATLIDIQTAYKKLAFKFHPESNAYDPFFVHLYAEITEAHKVLSDESRRFRYDRTLDKELSAEVDRILDRPSPIVASFFSSKTSSKVGDVLTLSWDVMHADSVHIDWIGDVDATGTRSVRVEDVSATEEYLSINLTATNTVTNASVEQRLSIQNLDFSPTLAAAKQLAKANKPKKKKSIKPKQSSSSTVKHVVNDDNSRAQEGSITAYILVGIMILFIVIMLYSLHLINPMF